MLTIDPPALDTAGSGGWRVSSRIRGPGVDQEVFFESDYPIAPTSETFIAAGLPVAMSLGLPLQIDGPVCPRFLENLSVLQEILADWHPRLSPVVVQASPGGLGSDVAVPERETFSFFSGGVDSFATVCRHQRELSRLILVWGFDIPRDNPSLWTRVRQHMAAAADGLGHPLISVETNVRQLLDRAGDWGVVTHGAALASVAHLFGRSPHRVLVPASHHLRDRFPWGTHPVLDPLWSSEALELVHDGAELTRLEKTLLVAEHEVALRHLRVCWRNPENAYNCGACEKCVRTMISLELAGCLEACSTLPHTLDGHLEQIVLGGVSAVSFARDNLARAREQGRRDIVRPLERALWRFRFRQAVRNGRNAGRTIVNLLRSAMVAGSSR